MHTSPRLLRAAKIIMAQKRATTSEAPAARGAKRVALVVNSEVAGSQQLGDADAVIHAYDVVLLPGVLSARYKRFLGDVTFPGDASPTVVHVPNTGPMTGLVDLLPAAALLSRSANPARKYAHTLEWVQPGAGAAWVGVHSAKANAMVARLLALRAIPELLPYVNVKAEVRYGAEKSRVDFVLERDGDGASACYTEVKSVTLAEDDADKTDGQRVALFPDTVSVRAQRHVRELMSLVQAGGSAALVFLVQRGDCAFFAPCHAKDPEYGRLVLAAAEAGVKLVAWACELDAAAGVVRSRGALPVRLRYGLDDP